MTVASNQQLVNLHAFARLYGVLRWFNPSDAASNVNWDDFAVEGVVRSLSAATPEALRAELVALTAAVAPAARIVRAGGPSDASEPPTDAAEVVAWEHQGYGDGDLSNIYHSKRRHRPQVASPAVFSFAALWQQTDIEPLRGANVRLRGMIRTAQHGRGKLWLRVERGDSVLFRDNMFDRPVSSSEWAPAEIAATIDREATRVVFGVLVSDKGTAWFDDIKLEVQAPDESWHPIDVPDAGFEAPAGLSAWKPGTGRATVTSIEGWDVTVDGQRPASGRSSLQIRRQVAASNEELFPEGPRPGEIADIDLGNGLHARVPLTLSSQHGQTMDLASPRLVPTLAMAARAKVGAFDSVTAIADVIVAWNVLQHFWPYWGLTAVNSDALLDTSLVAALQDRAIDAHANTLRHLVGPLEDGHGQVRCPGEARMVPAPFAVAEADQRLFVTASSTPELEQGDEIISVNGQRPAELVAEAMTLLSGSAQWRRHRALAMFGSGTPGASVVIQLRRADKLHHVTVIRGKEAPAVFAHAPIAVMPDGVYYVDLSRASPGEIQAKMTSIASAPGVVFDARNEFVHDKQILSHLLHEPDHVPWYSVPVVLRPDHKQGSMSWQNSGWDLPADLPRIGGRVAFVIGPGTFSYGESVMLIVSYYQLGAIMGSATAGDTGDAEVIDTPSDCRVYFTGSRVVRPDGIRFHGVGVAPTIPAVATVAGLIAGRDEVLDKALAYVRSKN